MQKIRSNRESTAPPSARNAGGPLLVRTELSTLLNEYTNSQQRYNARLESLEREMASLKGQVTQSFDNTEDNELNRTYTLKKAPSSARTTSPSRIPLPVTPRRGPSDNGSVASGKTVPMMRAPASAAAAVTASPPAPLPMMPIVRSQTFHPSSSSPPPPSSNNAEENSLLRAYRLHLEKLFRRESGGNAEIKIPTYNSIEDVIKANERLLLENERLRSELNRLKTESILLLRSMKTVANESENQSGNERIMAERERQELAIELARQVEENKRLRKSLLAQSEKFLTLRRSTHANDVPAPVSFDHRQTPESTSHTSLNSVRTYQSKSARHHSDSRGYVRPRSLYHGPQ